MLLTGEQQPHCSVKRSKRYVPNDVIICTQVLIEICVITKINKVSRSKQQKVQTCSVYFANSSKENEAKVRRMYKSNHRLDPEKRPPWKQTQDSFSRKLHLHKRDNARPSVDTKCPTTYMHFYVNLKKIQQLEDMNVVNERENRRLAGRILRMMVRKSCIDNRMTKGHNFPATRRNLMTRGRDFMKVILENQALLKRITCAKSHYNVKRWEEEYKKDKAHLILFKNKTHKQEVPKAEKYYLAATQTMSRSSLYMPENLSLKQLRAFTEGCCSQTCTDRCGDPEIAYQRVKPKDMRQGLEFDENGQPIIVEASTSKEEATDQGETMANTSKEEMTDHNEIMPNTSKEEATDQGETRPNTSKEEMTDQNETMPDTSKEETADQNGIIPNTSKEETTDHSEIMPQPSGLASTHQGSYTSLDSAPQHRQQKQLPHVGSRFGLTSSGDEEIQFLNAKPTTASETSSEGPSYEHRAKVAFQDDVKDSKKKKKKKKKGKKSSVDGSGTKSNSQDSVQLVCVLIFAAVYFAVAYNKAEVVALRTASLFV